MFKGGVGPGIKNQVGPIIRFYILLQIGTQFNEISAGIRMIGSSAGQATGSGNNNN